MQIYETAPRELCGKRDAARDIFLYFFTAARLSGPRAARVVVFGEGWSSLSDVYFSFINSF